MCGTSDIFLLLQVHFKASDWADRDTSRKLLKSSAVPSIFCQQSECLPNAAVTSPAPGMIIIEPSAAPYHASSCAVAVSTDFYCAPQTPRKPLLEKQFEDLNNIRVHLQGSVQQLERQVVEARKVLREKDRAIAALQTTSDHNLMLLDSVLDSDQLRVLESGGKSQGKKWSMATVEKALQVQLHGGPSTLKVVNDIIAPLPGVRTIQRRTAPIKFRPGILHEFLGPLKKRVEESFSTADRDCALHFDEMSLKEQLCFDTGLNEYIGNVTLEGGEGLASKMEVWTFAGIQRRWKVNAAYHFTPAESLNVPRAKVALYLLKYCEHCHLNCKALCCDMGNRGLLTELGFNFTKDHQKFSIVHPYNKEKRLRVVPDPVHCFKAVKEMMQNNPEIDLGQKIASDYNLPTSIAKFQHVEWIVDYQKDMDVTFVPRLSEKDLSKSHFSKMGTSGACHIFSDKSAAAMEFLVEENVFEEECKTTAWFISVMNKWFSIVTSRSLVHALSKRNLEAYNEAITVMNLVIEIFTNMKVGNAWKPVQTHIVMATRALLELQQELLEGENYSFLFLGRFANDISENGMSRVRRRRPNPTCLEAKYSLKQDTISQCSVKIVKSQYSHDDRENLLSLQDILDFIEKERLKEGNQKVILKALPWQIPPEMGSGYKGQNFVHYRMCGYVLHSMRRSGQLPCNDCFKLLQHQEKKPHFLARWTKKTDFTVDAQIQVCSQLFKLYHALDFNIKSWRCHLLKSKHLPQLVWKSIEPVLDRYPIATCGVCSNVRTKIIKRFVSLMLKLLPKKSSLPKGKGSHLASKSMGYRYLASNYIVGGKKKSRCSQQTRKVKQSHSTKPTTKTSDSVAQNNVSNNFNQKGSRVTRSKVKSLTMDRLKRLP